MKKTLLIIGMSFLLIGCSEETTEKPEEIRPKQEDKITEETTTETTTEPTPTETTTEPVEEPAPNLNINYQDFNTAIVNQYEEIEGSFDGIVASNNKIGISPSISFNSEINPDNSVRSVKLTLDMTRVDQANQSLDFLDYMLAESVLVTVLNPEISKEDIGVLILNTLSAEEIIHQSKEATVGNVRYKFFFDTNNGYLTLEAKHKDDK